MNTAKVSIIIPVYNGANFLDSAIESALNQTYKETEIIVVNDGSTDQGETKRIAEKYLGRIRYFEKENGGVASALNLGLSQMTGDYFSWLSHDDYYHPDKILKSVEEIEKANAPCVVMTNYVMHDLTNNCKSFSELKKSIPGIVSFDREVYQYALIKCFFKSLLHMCSALIPIQVVKELGNFDESLITTQDYDFIFRLAKANYRIIILDAPLLTTRHHALQGTKTMDVLHVLELESLYIAIFEYFKPIFQDLPFRLYFKFIDVMYTRGLEAVCFTMLNIFSSIRNDSQTPIWLYWENKEDGKTPEYIYQCWYSIISRNARDFSINIVTPKTLSQYLPNLNSNYLGFNEIAHRADCIRFNLLHEFGGIWLDSDFISFRSLKPIKKMLNEKGFIVAGYKEKTGILFPIISFLASRKNNPIVAKVVGSIDRFIQGPLSINGRQPLWDEIGGDNLKKILLEEEEYAYIDIKYFYPIPTYSTNQIIRGEGIHFDFETLAYGQNISHSDFGDKIAKMSKQELLNPSTVLGKSFLLGFGDVFYYLEGGHRAIFMQYFLRMLTVWKSILIKSSFAWGAVKFMKKFFYGAKLN